MQFCSVISCRQFVIVAVVHYLSSCQQTTSDADYWTIPAQKRNLLSSRSFNITSGSSIISEVALCGCRFLEPLFKFFFGCTGILEPLFESEIDSLDSKC